MEHRDLRSARRARRASENKAYILEAAENVFINKGFAAATMDEIAAAAQFSKATLYKYFPGKWDLILSIIDHAFEEVSDGVDTISRKDQRAEMKLAELIEFICDYYHRKKNIVRLFFMEKFSSARALGMDWKEQGSFSSMHPKVPDALAGKMTRISDGISRIIREGVGSGEFREVDPEDATHFFGAMIRGFHFRGPFHKKNYSLEESTRLLNDFFLNGIRKV